METNDTPSIFEVSITAESRQYLNETARWGKVLAIAGFIFSGLIIIAGLFVMVAGSAFGEVFGSVGGSLGAVAGVVYIVLGAVYFYPSLKLLRFSAGMQEGFRNGDQQTITTAFQNLKSVFRFWGILTIVIIGLYGLIIVLAMVFGAFASMN